MVDKENVGGMKKEKANTAGEKSSKRGTTRKSAQSGSVGVKPAAKRTKQSDKVLAELNANNMVTKRTGGVGVRAKRPYQKKTYQKVARVTRSSTKLTGQLSPDSKPYLSCKPSSLSALCLRLPLR